MLLEGEVADEQVDRFAEILATIHTRSSTRLDELEPEFGDRSFFETLRLEPYYGYAAEQTPRAATFLLDLQRRNPRRASHAGARRLQPEERARPQGTARPRSTTRSSTGATPPSISASPRLTSLRKRITCPPRGRLSCALPSATGPDTPDAPPESRGGASSSREPFAIHSAACSHESPDAPGSSISPRPRTNVNAFSCSRSWPPRRRGCRNSSTPGERRSGETLRHRRDRSDRDPRQSRTPDAQGVLPARERRARVRIGAFRGLHRSGRGT